MTIRPEDRALAAYLIEREMVPMDELLRALDDARASERDLVDVLVEFGTVSAAALEEAQGELAKRDGDASENSTVADRSVDDDTWFDLVGEAKIVTPPPENLWDEEVPTRIPGVHLRGHDDFDGLGPTAPSEPSRSDYDVLDSDTIKAGAGVPQVFDLDLPKPRIGKSSGVELQIERSEQRLAPSGKSDEERYQMLGEIGRGGMGRILKARDTEIGREVAVKVLLGGGTAPDNLIRRFWTEVQATGQLEHPSIVPIHDVGRLPSGELFYVMKMLSGRTLAEILQGLRDGDPNTAKEFTRVRMLTIFQQIAYAVAFSHAHGVIHRDIKPGNIMVGRYGEAILLDWGLAKIQTEGDPEVTEDLPRVNLVGRYSASETASGTITGTPQYMSPEATEGQPEKVTSKSDVYGLGATLYEIVTLQPAFPDLGFVPTVMRVRRGDFLRPRERAPDLNIPVDLEEICLSAMQEDPEARPGAKKLADDIGAFLEGAKERQRRTEEAKARIREGRRATDRWKQLKIELQSAESEAKKLAKEVPTWEGVEKKARIWTLEDRVSELKIEAIAAFEEAEAAFLRALGEVPDDREARSALAALYFARFGEAERARDVEGQKYYRTLVSRYDDGVWERVLEGDGTLEVTADPGDVEVGIARLESIDRVLRPSDRRFLGRVPIQQFEIPIGSYLLFFSRPNDRQIVRPVLIGRTESVAVHLKWRSVHEIGEDFVLIPEGPAIIGGDSIAHGGLERRVLELPEYAIARFPVTCDEYLEFLNDLAAKQGVETALHHVPRARAQEGHYWRFSPERRRFEYPPKSPGGHAWVGTLPVNGVSMEDANAYIEWKRSISDEKLRLPHENEWEKAARGVDGRFFPWGDHFDPTFCKMKESRNVPYPEPEPVGAFPIDCSPYGARDMAGGMRELCVTDIGGVVMPVMRGGCWSDTGLFCRVAFRHITQRDFVNTGLGFRLAKDLE
jgi:eukaryotic-like serine/threonine-protein kinase